MPDTPLNPDALDHLATVVFGCTIEEWNEHIEYEKRQLLAPYRRTIETYLAAAQPEVNSVEELDALPIGSAVLSEKYIAQQEDEEYPCVFQKLYTGDWHRGGRSSDTHPDYFLPARVLYRPEVNDA